MSWTVQKINNCFTHPTPGGTGVGVKFSKKCGKFHELPRKSIKKLTPTSPTPPHPTGGGGGGRGENFKVTKH